MIKNDPLDTPLARLLGIEIPVLQAGMGMGARARLAAAVSSAGGLGVIGGAPLSPDELETQIAAVREQTDRPLGVDLLLPPEFTGGKANLAKEAAARVAQLPAIQQAELGELAALLRPGWVDAQVEACLKAGVEVLIAGLGSPEPYVAAAHDVGTKVLALAGTVEQAQRHATAGVDAVIASGSDAGGHTGRIGSLSLWAAITDAIDLPVAAAGGIADGRTFAAALVLGCQGAWIGTRFLATVEADVPETVKGRVVAMGAADTVVTRSYSGKPMRVIRNRWTDSWRDREHEALSFPLQAVASEGRSTRGLGAGDVEEGAVPAGQGLGLIPCVEKAGDVVADLARGARAALRRW